MPTSDADQRVWSTDGRIEVAEISHRRTHTRRSALNEVLAPAANTSARSVCWSRNRGGSVGRSFGAVRRGGRDEFVGRHLCAVEFGCVVAAVVFDELACLIAEVKAVLESKSGRVRIEMSKD